MADMIEHLRRQATTGGPDAQFRLARTLYQAGTQDEALALLGAAAKAGHLPAMTELGSRLVTGAGAPLAPVDGDAILRFAAGSGDPLAARHLALLEGSGLRGAPDWKAALDWMATAAAQGDDDAGNELQAMAGRAVTGDRWSELAEYIDLSPWLAPAVTEPLSDSPSLTALHQIAAPVLCQQLLSRVGERLEVAGVTDRRTGRFMHDAARTNHFVQVKLFDLTLALMLLRARMATAIGQPLVHFEIMNLLRYDPGEAFDLHHDYLDPREAGFTAELARDGQRVATLLVYLNDDYEAGETHFPALNLRFRGKCGDGLMFRNVDRHGDVDPATLHAGLSPSAGRKWLLSQWVRDRPQRAV